MYTIYSILFIIHMLNFCFIVWILRGSFWLYQFYFDKFSNDSKFRTLFSVGHHGGFLKEERLARNPRFYAAGAMQGLSIFFIFLYIIITYGAVIYALYVFWLPEIDHVNRQEFFEYFFFLVLYFIIIIHILTIVYYLLCVTFVVVFEKFKKNLCRKKLSTVNMVIADIIFLEYDNQIAEDKIAIKWTSLLCTYMALVLLTLVTIIYIVIYDWLIYLILEVF